MSFGNGSIDLTSRANGERFNLIFREIVVASTVPGLDFAQPIQRPRSFSSSSRNFSKRVKEITTA
jgi:hypothetical protein